MEILAITDDKNFANLTGIRIKQEGHTGESIFSKALTQRDLGLAGDPIRLNGADLILVQNMGDIEGGLGMVRGLRVKTETPIILAIWGGLQRIKNRLEVRLATEVVDMPNTPDKFKALLEEAQGLVLPSRQLIF